MAFSPSVLGKAQNIKLLAMDVDGVLTDGKLYYGPEGEALKSFDVKDGHGIALLCHLGFPVAWITGRESAITDNRAKELKVPYLYQRISKKLPVLENLCQQLGISLSEVAYIGDDIPDLSILKVVGLAVCPSDALEELKTVCHHVTQLPGGHGAVREVADLILNTHPTLLEKALVVLS